MFIKLSLWLKELECGVWRHWDRKQRYLSLARAGFVTECWLGDDWHEDTGPGQEPEIVFTTDNIFQYFPLRGVAGAGPALNTIKFLETRGQKMWRH